MTDTQAPDVVVTEADKQRTYALARKHCLTGTSAFEKCHREFAAHRLSTQSAMQAEIDRLTANGIHTCHDQCQRVACVLRRKNGILRETLNEIEHAESVEIARCLARAALTKGAE